jgi:hypothetical protein
VITVQAWARHTGDELQLLQSVVANLNQSAQVVWGQDGRRIPAVYAARASTLGGQVQLDLRNTTQAQGQVTARLRLEDGRMQDVAVDAFGTNAFAAVKHQMPLFLDAMVDIQVGGRVVDKVWLADGTWLPTDSQLTADVSPAGFESLGCHVQSADFANEAAISGIDARNALRFAGCGAIKRLRSAQAGVARTFAGGGLDMRAYQRLVFRARSATPFRACLESERRKAASCIALPATSGAQWFHLPLAQFTDQGGDPRTLVSLVNFVAEGDIDLEVAGLSLAAEPPSSTTVTDMSTSGCAAAPARVQRGWGSGLAALLVGAAMRVVRRRRNRQPE